MLHEFSRQFCWFMERSASSDDTSAPFRGHHGTLSRGFEPAFAIAGDQRINTVAPGFGNEAESVEQRPGSSQTVAYAKDGRRAQVGLARFEKDHRLQVIQRQSETRQLLAAES